MNLQKEVGYHGRATNQRIGTCEDVRGDMGIIYVGFNASSLLSWTKLDRFCGSFPEHAV